MLHTIPNSTERARLLEVVQLQRQLMEALCGLPGSSVVDQAWVQGVWPALPPNWVRRFWENDNGNRADWILAIATASLDDKQTIRTLLDEQLRFAELYDNPPGVRLTRHVWSQGVFHAVNKLLKSFYAPMFYKDEGFPDASRDTFHKDQFILGFNPAVKICPYTDTTFQDTKLDHFLPQDQFPMLTCHPDNLIPCSTDSNSGSHKGTTVPLDFNELDQAGAWFHPRWRNSVGAYHLTFPSGPAPQPRINFVAHAPRDQSKVDNMARIFGLSEFWGSYLGDAVQNVATDVNGLLKFDNLFPTVANVRSRVELLARQIRGKIGREDLAISKSFFYEHIANTPVLLAQIVRTCTQGT